MYIYLNGIVTEIKLLKPISILHLYYDVKYQ